MVLYGQTLINKSSQLKGENHYCYYFEPFYQLMRQTLWAEQMLQHKDTETLKADNYLHLHIIPGENSDLLDKIYKCSNKDMSNTWRNHLIDKTKYVIISPKELLAKISREKYGNLLSYLETRYWDK
ncbi:MAG: PGN_0703 family putative restriction endonuclease [Bacteroidota bacterium]